MSNSPSASGCAPSLVGLVAFTFMLIGILLGAGAIIAYLHGADDGLERLNLAAAPIDTDDDLANAPFALALPLVDTLRAHRSLEASTIAEHIQSERQLFQDCYASALDDDPTLIGEIDLQFSISGSSGDVQVAVVRNSSLDDASVEQCLVDQIQEQWSFSAPDVSGVAEVRFDILFVPISTRLP